MTRLKLLACTSVLAISATQALSQSADGVSPFAILASDLGDSSGNVTIYQQAESAGSASLETSPGDQVIFRDTATASSADIINNGGATRFEDSSTAASATMTANDAGHIGFRGSSTAADSRIVINGGGELTFEDDASAGAAFITDNSSMRFAGRSTANRANITVNQDGRLTFEDNSRAGVAQIANNGRVEFSGSASLEGGGVVNNIGAELAFRDSSNAGTTSNVTNSGTVSFADTSSLGDGSITGNETSRLRFAGRSSAGTGFISTSGELAFSGESSAADSEIIANAGSTVTFDDASSAGNARIAGETDLRFAGRSSAGNAALIMSPGATVSFHDDADGGTAQLQLDAGSSLDITNANGTVGLGQLSGAGDVSLGARTLAVGDDTPLVDFAGTITDGGEGGDLTKRGTGTFNLSGQNAYSGTTRVEEGVLEAGAENTFSAASTHEIASGATLDLGAFDQKIGGLSGAGTVDLATATLTTGGNGASTTFAGEILGDGGLTKEGAGELVLSGISSYLGPTDVLGGVLRVDGSIESSSALTIARAATLTGSGRVGSTVVDGTLAVGASGGPLNVIGDLTFTNDATMVVEVGAAQAGSVAVTGDANLAGTLSVEASGNISANSRYEIVQAAAVNGTFDALTSDLAFLDPELDYGATRVDLGFARNAVAYDAVAQTPNQHATAGAIEALGSGNDVHDAVLPMNAAGARAAFDNLSGEGHANVLDAMASTRGDVRRAVLARLRERSQKKTGVWAIVQSASDGSRGDGDGAAFDLKTVSVVGGVDFRPTDNFVFGIFGSYGTGDLKNPYRRTRGDIRSASVGVYAGYSYENLRLRGGAEYARHDVSLSRDINAGSLKGTASSDYSGWSANVFGEVAYAANVAGITIEPYLGVSHLIARTNGFRESGAGAANLASAGNRMQRTDVEVGIRASTTYLTRGGMRVRPSVAVGYSHNVQGGAATSRHSFAGSNSYAVMSGRSGEGAAVVEARVDVDFTEQLGAGFFYRGAWMRDGDTHAFGASLTYRF